MRHPAHDHRPTITDDFLTYGNIGIDLNRAAERSARERADHHPGATLHASSSIRKFRRLLGAMLITAGTALSGTASNPVLNTSDPHTA